MIPTTTKEFTMNAKPTLVLSTDDRLRLCSYASNLRLSNAICWNPEKFKSPRIQPDESHEDHYNRVLEYRNALTEKFDAIQAHIRAKYAYLHHKFPVQRASECAASGHPDKGE
jgi:hypothetical protein